MADSFSFQQALAGWRAALGTEQVKTEPALLAAVATATFATSQRILAVLLPADREQVQAAVRIAGPFGVPIYPISGGKNWGLGSRVPVTDGCVLLDLGRMNRITDYREDLACITVEPGVTFRQVHAFLKERGSRLALSVIGGSPEASIIGNTVERGDGLGPCGDRLSSVCDLEVVLPGGECLRTGLGRFANAHAAPVCRTGVGPALDGLFTQSNLGIVTRLTLWLMPRPSFYQAYAFSVPAIARLAPLFDAVRPLLLQRVLPENSFSLWNSYKVLMTQGRYPWKALAGQTPLSLRARYGSEPWYGNGALFSFSRERGLLERRELAEILGGLVEGLEFTDQEQEPSLLEEDVYLGNPWTVNLRAMYWRKRNPSSEVIDPDRDGCGVLWLCLVFPLLGSLIVEALTGVEETVLRHGLEPSLGLQVASGRTVHVFLMLAYDRSVAGEDERAMACHDQVLADLVRQGHYPYRLGIHSMDQLPAGNDDTAAVLARLKHALDPKGILAPGRYIAVR